MQSETCQPGTGENALMAAELERLNSPLGLLRNFPDDMERSFRVWLDRRMQELLRQYLWALVLLLGALVAVTGICIHEFTVNPVREHELRVFALKSAAVCVIMLMLFVAVRQPAEEGLFRRAVALVSVGLLVVLGIGVPVYQDDYSRLMGLINLWVAATVIFATGLHLPRSCLVIMLLALPGVMLGAVAFGATGNLLRYAVQLVISGIFLLIFSFVMARVHRQVFLQEGILLWDKKMLTELSEQLADMSLKDALTGVANRRRFDEVLEREWARSQRQQSPLGLLFIDVDSFKAYNDHYGHQAGDDCLRALAFVLMDSGRRRSDLVARYGGEEFVLLLPDTDELGAMDAARRIRAFLAQAALPHEATMRGQVTVSIGVAVSIPAGGNAAVLVAAADKAVYQAKKDGRDCVVLAREPETSLA